MRLKTEKAIANGSVMPTKMIWMGQGLEIKGMDLLTCLASSLSVYRGKRGEMHTGGGGGGRVINVEFKAGVEL
jgi:hypothetical protein